MLVLAHRGFHKDVPPNTHSAFERALRIGVDGIETDVRLSADGKPILYHDRCAPGGKLVARLTHEELERLAGYSIPTLEGAIAEWGDILWNLELKTASAVEPAARIVERYRSKRRFLVTSFDHPIVFDFVRRTDVEGGLLVAHKPLNFVSLEWTGSDPRLRTIVWDYETSAKDSLAAATDQGFRNFVYGPITRQEHQNLTRWKVDGAITDYPGIV